MVMNYDETAAALRGEIERLEREHGVEKAYPATAELLQALECLRSAKIAVYGEWKTV